MIRDTDDLPKIRQIVTYGIFCGSELIMQLPENVPHETRMILYDHDENDEGRCWWLTPDDIYWTSDERGQSWQQQESVGGSRCTDSSIGRASAF